MRGFGRTKTLLNVAPVRANFQNQFTPKRHFIDRHIGNFHCSAAWAKWQSLMA